MVELKGLMPVGYFENHLYVGHINDFFLFSEKNVQGNISITKAAISLFQERM